MDLFRITPTVTGTWVFTATGQAPDPLMGMMGCVTGSDGNGCIFWGDNRIAAESTRIRANLTAGMTYYVLVHGTQPGNYTITAMAPPAPPPLVVDTTNWSVPVQGESKTVQVTSNVDWSVQGPDWVTLSTASGNGNGSVTLTAKANDSGSARVGAVTFAGGGFRVQVVVSQAVPSPQFTVSPTALQAVGSGATLPVTITASGAWTVNAPPWITASDTSGSGNAQITLTVQANPMVYTRFDDVTFTSDGKTVQVMVYQTGAQR